MAGNLGAVKALTFPLLSDPDRKIMKAYGVEDPETELAWPSIYIVDAPDGKVAWRWAADIYKDRIAAADVLAALPK